jgi:thymidylate synthase ThyX
LSPGADAEFQEVAGAILDELKREAPNTFQDFDEDFE